MGQYPRLYPRGKPRCSITTMDITKTELARAKPSDRRDLDGCNRRHRLSDGCTYVKRRSWNFLQFDLSDDGKQLSLCSCPYIS